MRRALLVPFAAACAAVSAPSMDLDAQVSLPGQVTPARPVPGATTPTGTAVIRGTVVAMDTGAPLGRVQIRAFGNTPDARGARATSTDDQGRFELRELPAGRYIGHRHEGRVRVAPVRPALAERARHAGRSGRRPDRGEDHDRLAARGGHHGPDQRRRRRAGRGRPRAGAALDVHPGGRRPMPAGREDQTDDLGAFRIYGLPPGEYYVSATFDHMGAMMDRRAARHRGQRSGVRAHLLSRDARAWPTRNASRSASARRCPASASALTPTRLSRISGRVIGWTAARGQGFMMAMPEEGMGTGPMMMPGTDPARGRLRDARRPAGPLRAARAAARAAGRRRTGRAHLCHA